MTDDSRVVRLEEFKKKKQDERRTHAERVFMHQVIGVFSVMADQNLRQIEMVDLSEAGLAFQVPFEKRDQYKGKEGPFNIRFYFNQESYMEVSVQIRHHTPTVQAGQKYMKFGCEVDPQTYSYSAYSSFVKFLRAYSEISQIDSGNVNVFFV